MTTATRARRARWPAAVLCAAALAGCSGGGAGEPPNVIFLLVDTLRADHLSLYGYDRPTSPTLEGLAAESVVFDHVEAQAGCTFPSVNSILSSHYTFHFLVPGRTDFRIPEHLPALPEILQRHGYATAAVSASPIVRSNGGDGTRGGYGRGFDIFDDECKEQGAACVNRRALRLLDILDGPVFLYLHYFDPHAPYQPPRDHQRRFAASRGEAAREGIQRWARRGNPFPLLRRLYQADEEHDYTAADVAHMLDLYDEEILYFDQQLAKLLAGITARGLDGSTLLVVAADHGEEFLEHGQFSHCRSIAYETVLAAPLLLRIPGVAGGVRRQALVQNLDIAPTLLDYLGLDAGPYAFEGRSLRPVIEGDEPVNRVAFGLQGEARTVRDGRYRLVHYLESGRTELYDLAEDPGETVNLAEEMPQVTARLRQVIELWMETMEDQVGAGTTQHGAQALERELRALGYL